MPGENPARLSSSEGERERGARLPDEKVQTVQAAVLEWYRRGHRELPWRRTRDPYAILVSEVMLQQTQVERVLPKYREWLERYPTLAALAAASRAEVIRTWAPLGYNLRAVRLHEIAREAVERYGGRLPDTMKGLLSLKGIGRYTAGAVACFAFGQAEPVLDTNVRRVLGRIFAAESPGATEDDRQAWALAEASLPEQTADCYDWNQALMDLGATVCVARNPRCLFCPAQAWCTARVEGGGPHPRPLSYEERGVWEGQLRGQDGAPLVGVPAPDRRGGLPLVAEERASYTPSPAATASAASTARGAGARRKRKGGEGERFEGSRRWFRGRIVDALRGVPAGESLGLQELGEQVKPGFGVEDVPWLEELVAALARDGLVEMKQSESEELRVTLPR